MNTQLSELDLRPPAKRDVSRMQSNMKAFEAKLMKKMMANPKDAKRDLKITIDIFKKKVQQATGLTAPIIKAQIKKFEDILAQLEKSPVNEGLFDNIKKIKVSDMDKLRRDPEEAAKAIDKVLDELKSQMAKHQGSGFVRDIMKGEIAQWERIRKYALSENLKERSGWNAGANRAKQIADNAKAYKELERKARSIARKYAGNMTKATQEIEKLKKGLSEKPAIQKMLRQYNEWVEPLRETAGTIPSGKKEFSADQLSVLRTEYSKLKSVDPNDSKFQKLRKYISDMDKGRLKQLAGANIPWLTYLAKVALREAVSESAADLKAHKMLVMYMRDPIYKDIAKAKTTTELKKALETARKIRGPDAVAKFQKAMKASFGMKSEMAVTSTANIPQGPESVGVKKKKTVEADGEFGDMPVFNCNGDTFTQCIKGKKKFGRWATYLGKDNPFFNKMQDWMGQSAKNKNFMLRNDTTGEMVYARRMHESVNEAVYDRVPFSKSEINTFTKAIRRFKGVQPMGRAEMTSNTLRQEFRTQNIKNERFSVEVAKEKNPFKIGEYRYFITLPGTTGGTSIQSKDFTKNEDIRLLQSALKDFEQRVLTRKLG